MNNVNQINFSAVGTALRRLPRFAADLVDRLAMGQWSLQRLVAERANAMAASGKLSAFDVDGGRS